jgi:deoxycytidine triphosphate deaminase
VAGTLCKAEISRLLADGKLILHGEQGRIRGCSYDCGVGDIFFGGKVFKKTSGEQGVTVPPGGIVALFTREILDLPDDIAGTAFPINAMSSKGLLVLNPGHIDPGFRGHLSIKALNLRKSEMLLRFDEPIFTVIFERLPHPTEAYKNNVDQAERAREFHQREVETTPRTILEACDLSRLTFGGTTRDEVEAALDRRWNTEKLEVDAMIRAHWMTRWTFILMLVAAVASCIAVALTIWPLANHPSSGTVSNGSGSAAVSNPVDPARNTEGAGSQSTLPQATKATEDKKKAAPP